VRRSLKTQLSVGDKYLVARHVAGANERVPCQERLLGPETDYTKFYFVSSCLLAKLVTKFFNIFMIQLRAFFCIKK